MVVGAIINRENHFPEARKTSVAGDAGPVRNVVAALGLTGRFSWLSVVGFRVSVVGQAVPDEMCSTVVS
jgi:hypothetical protein